MKINLSRYPNFNKTYSVNFPNLSGGLNMLELPYKLDANESPKLQNLWWQDGILQSRDGQFIAYNPLTSLTAYTCAPFTFHGYAFFHIGTKLYFSKVEKSNRSLSLIELLHASGYTANTISVAQNRGTFFLYDEYLFYKNDGSFFRIKYNPGAAIVETARFEGVNLTASYASAVVGAVGETVAYVPTILINAVPATCAGDLYQPENRLSPQKRVRYNADGTTNYKLPVTGASIVRVLNGTTEVTSEHYEYTSATGILVFDNTSTPESGASVQITYSLSNTAAYSSLMHCKYGFVGTAGNELCILMAGCEDQPNAVFWNSNDNLSMNPTYWPVEYYNLLGATADPITGFGQQYSDIIVFKERSVGKLEWSITTAGSSTDSTQRNVISYTYLNINSKTGCDLPWTIQLVDNNLVFCNTYQGVHLLRSSSAAYENNVELISRKVNDGRDLPGLLPTLRSGMDKDAVCSFDDDNRYWVVAGGKAYVWDYLISDYSDPSWFYMTNIDAVSFFSGDSSNNYCLKNDGVIFGFDGNQNYDVYLYTAGAVREQRLVAIEKIYSTPVQTFGTYERKKDIVNLLFALKSVEPSAVRILYSTDYETRYDLTDVAARDSWMWHLVPMRLNPASPRTNIGPYSSAAPRFAGVQRRRPGCRHIHHFSVTFSNDTVGQDLALVSLQLDYRFSEKER